MRDLSKPIAFLRSFLIELALYVCFVVLYFFLVIHLISGWIDHVYNDNRILYAVLALALIVGQGFALERLTSALMWLVDRLQAVVLILRRLIRPHETIIRPKSAPGLLIYRFGGPLFFFNVDYFADRVQGLIDRAILPISVFLINAEAIVDMDSDAAERLSELHDNLKSQNIVLGVCEAKGHFLETLKNSGLSDRESFKLYPSVAAAIEDAEKGNAE